MAGAPSQFDILLTEGAEQDFEALYDYIAEFDCVAANANGVLDALMDVIESLSIFPERGSYPKELVGLGIQEYRQTFFKPYRVICRPCWREDCWAHSLRKSSHSGLHCGRCP